MPRQQSGISDMDMPILEVEPAQPQDAQDGAATSEVTIDRREPLPPEPPAQTREQRMLDECKKMYYAGFLCL